MLGAPGRHRVPAGVGPAGPSAVPLLRAACFSASGSCRLCRSPSAGGPGAAGRCTSFLLCSKLVLGCGGKQVPSETPSCLGVMLCLGTDPLLFAARGVTYSLWTHSRERTDTQTLARRYQCTPNMQGEGLAGLRSSCPGPSGLGTDCRAHSTGSCVGKASCRGDDPVTARRWHPGAPERDRHPGSVLSSSKIPCPQEGTGSHRGRSQGRPCAAAESE